MPGRLAVLTLNRLHVLYCNSQCSMYSVGRVGTSSCCRDCRIGRKSLSEKLLINKLAKKVDLMCSFS